MSYDNAKKSLSASLGRLSSLDGFRGLGCLLVMLGHTQWAGVTVLPGAVIAMDLFFVLSGFLICGLLISEWNKKGRIDLWQFWKRRAIRLLPAFYVYFSIGATAYLISKFKPIVGDDATYALLSTGLYFSNWIVAQGYNLGIFFVTWSLSLEEQFYAICPLLLIVLFKNLNPKRILVVLGGAILVVNIYRSHLFHEMLLTDGFALAWKRCFYGLDTRADSLLIGCFAAFFWHLYQDKIRIPNFVFWSALTVFFSSLAIRDLPIAYRIDQNSFYSEFLMSGGFTFYSLLGAIIIIHLVQSPNTWFARFLSSKPISGVGVISYSVYLYHTTIFGGLDIALKSMDASLPLWILKIAIKFSVALGIGYLSFRYVEMAVINKFNPKREYSPVPESSGVQNESTKYEGHYAKA